MISWKEVVFSQKPGKRLYRRHFFPKNAPCPQKSPKNTYILSAFDISRPRQMIDSQYGTTIMGGREVSRPYRVWFFAEGELFFIFFVSVPPEFIHRTEKMAKCVG